MNQRMHKRALYRRVRAGRVDLFVKVMGEIRMRLPRHVEYDEYYKLPIRGIDWAKAGEIARIDKGVSLRSEPAAVNPFA